MPSYRSVKNMRLTACGVYNIIVGVDNMLLSQALIAAAYPNPGCTEERSPGAAWRIIMTISVSPMAVRAAASVHPVAGLDMRLFAGG